MPPQPAQPEEITFVERAIASIGSGASLVIHSFIFAGFFSLSIFGVIEWSLMLLVLTTLVSLEAIYLAIFIQITVNRHTKSLKEVEEDIEEIQEDVEELGEDVEDIQEDIEEIAEDIDEIQEDVDEMTEEEKEEKAVEEGAHLVREEKKRVKRVADEAEMLEKLAKDVQRVLADLEALKAKK
ncbi:MAG: hypothetical protein AAB901_00390 [Patescibacteria group bacterium]